MGKRQVSSSCDGENRSTGEDGVSDSLTIDDQSDGWKDVLGNPDKSIELATSARQGAFVSGEDQSSDNEVANGPLEDAVVDPSWSVISGNVAPVNADVDSRQAVPGAIASSLSKLAAKKKIEQYPDDEQVSYDPLEFVYCENTEKWQKWPTEDFCPAQPGNTYGVYLVRLMEYDIGMPQSNLQAILVSDIVKHATFKYEAVKAGQRKFVWQ